MNESEFESDQGIIIFGQGVAERRKRLKLIYVAIAAPLCLWKIEFGAVGVSLSWSVIEENVGQRFSTTQLRYNVLHTPGTILCNLIYQLVGRADDVDGQRN